MTLFLVTIGVLLFPFVAGLFNVPEKPLKGAYYLETNPELTFASWFSGSFQEQKNKFLTSSFGFHNFYVRLNSELDFSVFKKAHARFVVVGKDNFLYESDYIKSYYGRDYIGSKKINEISWKLRRVQDTLEKLNKLIMVVLAPGKASFYPEYIPERFKGPTIISNYQSFASSLLTHDIPHIDFNKFFRSQKAVAKYPLYPQYGIHWSNYASTKAFDSIARFVEHKLKVDLPELITDSIVMSDSLRYPDNDIGETLNLMRELKTFPMAYPSVHMATRQPQHKTLKLLVIADSFWWYIYSTGSPSNVFGTSSFWFYNTTMYPESFTEETFVQEHNYFEKIKEADVIVLLHTESTLHRFGDGFVDMCYETYYTGETRKKVIQARKGAIRATTEWFSQIKQKAAEENVPVDTMLTRDALYSLDLK